MLPGSLCDVEFAPAVWPGHQGDVDVVRWHPNCAYLATASTDRTLRLWDVRAGECVRVLVGHQAPVSHRGHTLRVSRALRWAT